MFKFKKVLLFLLCFTLFIIDVPISAYERNENSDYVDFVISFNNAIDTNIEQVILNSGGEVLSELPELGGIEVKCSPDLIPTIKASDSVESISPNYSIELTSNEKFQSLLTTEEDSSDDELSDDDLSDVPLDLYSAYQWDIKRVTNNGESFNLESGNHNIVVGIIDSGIDSSHPDLSKNFLGGKNLVPKNFLEDSSETGDINDIDDRFGHGTNVAGFIAANGRTKGVAPNIGFKSYRVFNENGVTNPVICSSAIIDAVNDGVNVINLSISGFDLKGKCYWTNPETGIKYNLGDSMAEYSLYKKAIKYAVSKGVTVVCASGNNGKDCSNKTELTNYLNEINADKGLQYVGLTYEVPGTIKNVITVSATDKNDAFASYSNYGNDFIDISAPGGNISDNFQFSDLCLTTCMYSGYSYTLGTSFSAPKVSAAAALLLCRNEKLSPKEIRKILCKTADKPNDISQCQYYGSGILNLYRAIKYIENK